MDIKIKEQHMEMFIDLLCEKVTFLNSQLEILRNTEQYANPYKEDYDKVRKSVEESIKNYASLKEQFTGLAKEYDRIKADNNDLTKQLEKAKTVKGEGKGGDAAILRIMVDYAKANGFTFKRADVMKKFIEEHKNGEQKPFSLQGDTPETEDSVQTPPETQVRKDAKPKAYNPAKVPFEGHTKCPNLAHDYVGNVIEVASYQCRKCVFYRGINQDECYVDCGFVEPEEK